MGNHHHRVTKMPYQVVEEDVEEEKEAVAAAFAPLINIAHFMPFSNVRRARHVISRRMHRDVQIYCLSRLCSQLSRTRTPVSGGGK